MSIIESLKGLVGARKVRFIEAVSSLQEFRAAIERERARADRSRHCFSLVIFETGTTDSSGSNAESLAEVLAMRLRSTDQVGWFEKRRIGALLYSTSAAGAWICANNVCQAVAAGGERPTKFTIHVYPPALGSFPEEEQNVFLFEQKKQEEQAQKAAEKRDKDKNDKPPTEPDDRDVSKPDGMDQNNKADSDPEGKITSYERRVTNLSEMVRDDENFMLNTEQSHLSSGVFFQPTSIVAEYCARPGLALHASLVKALPPWKRIMDVLASGFCLLLFSPILLLTTLLIKIVSPGPVFFRQQRVGYLGRVFTMWKFRTMHANTDSKEHREYLSKLIRESARSGDPVVPMTKIEKPSQLIPFGSFLRKTCIDELPQLFNVFFGDMCLVGPRPPIPYEADEYLRWHNGRFGAVPGMTGLWQVSGKNKLAFNEMARLDIRYSRNCSFFLDLKILTMTPFVVLAQIRERT